jgi:hypothetical protein
MSGVRSSSRPFRPTAAGATAARSFSPRSSSRKKTKPFLGSYDVNLPRCAEPQAPAVGQEEGLIRLLIPTIYEFIVTRTRGLTGICVAFSPRSAGKFWLKSRVTEASPRVASGRRR